MQRMGQKIEGAGWQGLVLGLGLSTGRRDEKPHEKLARERHERMRKSRGNTTGESHAIWVFTQCLVSAKVEFCPTLCFRARHYVREAIGNIKEHTHLAEKVLVRVGECIVKHGEKPRGHP